VFEREKTFLALHRAANVIGLLNYLGNKDTYGNGALGI
jgi:hypothetical protein